jgi:hypothetical protein
MKSERSSEVFAFRRAATLANIQRHQSALASIELFFLAHFPFVEAVFAQGFALVDFAGLFAARGTFKGKNVSHVVIV